MLSYGTVNFVEIVIFEVACIFFQILPFLVSQKCRILVNLTSKIYITAWKSILNIKIYKIDHRIKDFKLSIWP